MNTEHFEHCDLGDGLGEEIAALGPDVSWTDDLPVPTPADIRARVQAFTPAERAAAERDAVRAEIGDTAMELGQAMFEKGDLDEAEKWLVIADDNHVPEARELLAVLRTTSFGVGDVEDTQRADNIIATATRRAQQILDRAREESDELIDAALVKMQKIIDKGKYSAAKKSFSTSLAGMTRSEPIGPDLRPSLLGLLWVLLDRWGFPISKPVDGSTRLRAMRVARGTALANLLSPVMNTTVRVGYDTGLMFRVLLIPESTSPPDRLLHVPPWHGYMQMDPCLHQSHYRSTTQSSRLVIALPSHFRRPGSPEPSDDFLMALAEHLMPDHDLTVEQVRRLSWDTIQDLLAQDAGKTAQHWERLLTNMPSNRRVVCTAVGTVAINGNVDLRWWNHHAQEGNNHDDYRSPTAGPDGRQRTEHDPADSSSWTAASVDRRDGTAAPAPHQASATVSSQAELSQLRRAARSETEQLTVAAALAKLDTISDHYLVFNDIASRHLTVVYRRAGGGQGVMKLGDMTPASIDSVDSEALRMLSDEALHRDQGPSNQRESHYTPKPEEEEEEDGFDDFLIIDSALSV